MTPVDACSWPGRFARSSVVTVGDPDRRRLRPRHRAARHRSGSAAARVACPDRCARAPRPERHDPDRALARRDSERPARHRDRLGALGARAARPRPSRPVVRDPGRAVPERDEQRHRADRERRDEAPRPQVDLEDGVPTARVARARDPEVAAADREPLGRAGQSDAHGSGSDRVGASRRCARGGRSASRRAPRSSRARRRRSGALARSRGNRCTADDHAPPSSSRSTRATVRSSTFVDPDRVRGRRDPLRATYRPSSTRPTRFVAGSISTRLLGGTLGAAATDARRRRSGRLRPAATTTTGRPRSRRPWRASRPGERSVRVHAGSGSVARLGSWLRIACSSSATSGPARARASASARRAS